MNKHHHFIVITLQAKGHINPALEFAKRLTRLGINVSFSATVSAFNHLTEASLKGLNLAPFSDGCDDQIHGGRDKDPKEYWSVFVKAASTTLRNVINSSSENGCPVTCLVYSPWFPWAATLAREYRLPSATLWIQPAMVMGIFYHYFHGYEDEVKKNVDMNDPKWPIQFPGLPLLETRDLPSFMLNSGDLMSSALLSAFRALMEGLDGEGKPNVLVNTFDALENDFLKAIGSYNIISVGPLTPIDGSFRGALFQEVTDCKEWLDSKDFGSVIYVSFGSMLTLPKEQMEEIASALLKTGRPFLWVTRANEETREDRLSCMEELEEKGMIVPWCSQLEVLEHSSVGCFVTHCGWNSTLESIVYGIPVVAFPGWSDQGTNAKLIEDVWRTGVRVTPNEEGRVESGEIVRCVDVVMDGGEKASELRNSAMKWRNSAREAIKDGGSLDRNLNMFLQSLVDPVHAEV